MNHLRDISNFFDGLWHQALDIWIAGGWCMPPIAFTAFLMFAIGIHIWLLLFEKGFHSVPEKLWRQWVRNPIARRGSLAELLNFTMSGASLGEMTTAFREVRTAEMSPIDRDLKIMRVCVGAAPLLGLLGTVTGMLATFDALASGSGGEKTMALVAKGISEALITTETGLVIALPGVFFQYHLARKCESLRAFLAHIETVCMQTRYQGGAAQAR